MKIKFNRTYESVNEDGLTQIWPPNAVFDVPTKIAKKAIKDDAAVSMEPAAKKSAAKKPAAKKPAAKKQAPAPADESGAGDDPAAP